jgi:ABC-type antimicrobial peptide transport system permease subunit
VSATAIPLFSNLVLPANVAGNSDGAPRGPFTQGNPMASPGFFDTLSIPFISGRDFVAADSRTTPAVAIVNEEFVRVHGLGTDPVGSIVRVEGPFVNAPVEVVGVVRDSSYSVVKGAVQPLLFTPRVPGDTSFANRFFYVATDVAPESFVVRVPRILAEIDPSLSVTNVASLARVSRNSVWGDRLMASLAASFAFLATLLTAIGLYGVLSYSVARRQRELGLRLALGAAPDRLLKAVLKQVAAMAGIGIAIGLLAGIALGRVAGGMLYGLSGSDPLVLAAAVTVAATVVLVASYSPARRASQVEPMRALRYE